MTDAQRLVRRDETSLVDTSGGRSPLAFDLLALAEQAFIADRKKFRGRSPDDDRWHRQLEITVPVRNAEVWSTADVRHVVPRLLAWLTDDTWSVTFVGRESGEPPRQIPLPLLAFGVVMNPAMGGYQRQRDRGTERSG